MYFITFINDSTRKVWAEIIQTKDSVFTVLRDRLAMVENPTDHKLKCLRSDNGREFKRDEFVTFCRECGIRREYHIVQAERHRRADEPYYPGKSSCNAQALRTQ